ncbi:MAG: hypothetical protein M0Z41_11585 [Peptococcaceae bacterium]|jgi:hypothetical protein|nr:hypothetical protein [Peptococcaceae bacterium]
MAPVVEPTPDGYLGGSPGEEGTTHVRYSLHPVLLPAGRIREDVADGRCTADADGAVRVTEGDPRDHLLSLAKAYRSRWGQEMPKMGLDHRLIFRDWWHWRDHDLQAALGNIALIGQNEGGKSSLLW